MTKTAFPGSICLFKLMFAFFSRYIWWATWNHMDVFVQFADLAFVRTNQTPHKNSCPCVRSFLSFGHLTWISIHGFFKLWTVLELLQWLHDHHPSIKYFKMLQLSLGSERTESCLHIRKKFVIATNTVLLLKSISLLFSVKKYEFVPISLKQYCLNFI